MKFNKRTFALLAISPLLVLIQLVASVYLYVQFTTTVNTHRNHDRLRTYLRNLINAETGQRGYLLTGDESYLEPYLASINHVQSSNLILDTLLSNHVINVTDIDHLKSLTANKLGELSMTISLYRAGNKEAAFKVVGNGQGKAVMDQIRAITETNIKQIKTAYSSADILENDFLKYLMGLNAIIFGFNVFFFVIAVRVINAERRLQQQLNTSLERQRNNLQEANKSITDFTYMTYHQLKEPLRNIASFLQLVQRRNQDKLDHDSHDFINQSVTATKDMATKINLLRETYLSNMDTMKGAKSN